MNVCALLRDFFSAGSENKEAKAISEDIHTASVRLIKIVHDFLDASALEQRVAKPTLTNLDLNVEVAEAVQQLRSLAKEKGLTLRITRTNEKPHVFADKERLKHVLLNVIGNAINYTRKGTITLRISTSDGKAKVTIQDTGIGIAPENQALLFRKFQQAGTEVLARDVTQGTGLGLYISNLMATSMGGSIQLEESTPGKGSIFSVILPLQT